MPDGALYLGQPPEFRSARQVLSLRGVTHRLDTRSQGGITVVEVRGLLDAVAVTALERSVRAVTSIGGKARVVLREGTEVDRECLVALCRLDADLVAHEPYLAHWISQERHR